MSGNINDLAEAVSTGWPITQLLACRKCGVLLWDIDKHYAHAHPSEDLDIP